MHIDYIHLPILSLNFSWIPPSTLYAPSNFMSYFFFLNSSLSQKSVLPKCKGVQNHSIWNGLGCNVKLSIF